MRSRVGLVFIAMTAGCGLLSGLDGLTIDDGGEDATVDVVVDAAEASTVDVVEVDAPNVKPPQPDSGSVSEPGVQCGTTTCVGQKAVCCRTADAGAFDYACVPGKFACSGLVIPCDSPDDCPNGDVCCVTTTGVQGCDVAGSVACVEAGACAFPNGVLCGNDSGALCPKDMSQCAVSTCTLPGYDICLP